QLKAAINSDPDNAELHFNLGVIYDQSEKPELAYESYMKALDADPEYLNALFNIGVYYRNQIVEKNKEKSNLGISKVDMAKGKVIDADLLSLSKKALPYWEKCDKINPDDQTTLETLQYIYLQIKDYDKAEVITERMEKLGYK
ncbi:MAG: tetratricopeptide repeat protein, partial [Cyclobacteriaceae bacterium]|nr:tetratricopeptide repeat protein [Cyclobacteriaceae bacterium]